MAGVMMNNSIPYDPFSTSYLIKDQQPRPQTFDYSPIALYSIPQEFSGPEFSGTGPAASSPELDSPLSPDSFSLPTANSAGNEWTSPFDRIESSDAFFKSESFDSPVLGSIPLQSLSSSPAINPMELSTAPVVMNDDVPFGGSEGGLMADSDPLFPSPQLARAQNPGHVNHYAPSNNNNNNNTVKSEITVTTRQSKRNNHSMKRKSSSSSSSSSGRSSASPPPPPPATSRPGLTRRATAPGNHTTGAGKEQGNSNSNSNGGGNGNGNAQAHHVSLPPKKTAHNMIEKRYRNNLNDKISALRDAVPALRVMVHRLETHHSGEAGSEDEMEGMEGADGGVNGRRMTAQDFEEDLGGLAPAHKLNKATILSKATEYIAHLERKNRALARENQGLRSKVEGFEMLMMNGAARTVWC